MDKYKLTKSDKHYVLLVKTHNIYNFDKGLDSILNMFESVIEDFDSDTEEGHKKYWECIFRYREIIKYYFKLKIPKKYYPTCDLSKVIERYYTR